MGETDEKENGPAGTPTAEIEEPKETEKLLSPSKAKSEKADSEKNGPENGDETADDSKPAEEEKKTNGEEIIDIPENKEKQPKEDGREVKPKKIPIGGIKMPGFFTRKPKTENDGAEGELLDNAGNEAKAEEPVKEPVETSARPSLLTTIKSWNPFAKKTSADAPQDGEEGDAKTGESLIRSEMNAFTYCLFSFFLCVCGCFSRIHRNARR